MGVYSSTVQCIYYTPLYVCVLVCTDRFRCDEIRVAFPPKCLIFTTGQGRPSGSPARKFDT